jgi:methylmalonyl-CoA/ethylmalonyl-CoA epimerase
MIIDHIGIVVKSIEEGIDKWERVFNYKQMTEVVVNSIQKVRVAFLQKTDSTTIKLIQPLDESSPVYKFAKNGGGLHHLCFKCGDLDNELTRLRELGFRILTEPEPGEAFCNEKIAFFYAKDGLNIELIDTELKYGIIS